MTPLGAARELAPSRLRQIVRHQTIEVVDRAAGRVSAEPNAHNGPRCHGPVTAHVIPSTEASSKRVRPKMLKNSVRPLGLKQQPASSEALSTLTASSNASPPRGGRSAGSRS